MFCLMRNTVFSSSSLSDKPPGNFDNMVYYVYEKYKT